GRATPAGRGWVLMVGKPDAPIEQWPTELPEAAAKGKPVYRMNLDERGLFSIHNVPAGSYSCEVNTYGDNEELQTASVDVLVGGSSGTVIDVGEVKLHARRALKVG